MWTELFLLAVTLLAVLATFAAIIYRMERNYWREEAEALQHDKLRKEIKDARNA
jgi:hypothetical protein